MIQDAVFVTALALHLQHVTNIVVEFGTSLLLYGRSRSPAHDFKLSLSAGVLSSPSPSP